MSTLRAVSFFFCGPSSKTRDKQMAPNAFEGARRERPSFRRLAASPLPLAGSALTKSCLIYPINKISVFLSHSKSQGFVRFHTFVTPTMFVISLRSIISCKALSIKLNRKVFVTFVEGHLCALLYGLQLLPVHLTSEISVVNW